LLVSSNLLAPLEGLLHTQPQRLHTCG
jgi:hypothetical protein